MGHKLTENAKKLIGDANRGRKFPIELYPNKGWRGKKHTLLHNQRIGIGNSKPKPEGFGKHLSELRKGIVFPESQIINMKLAQKERWRKYYMKYPNGRRKRKYVRKQKCHT
jgi:hypothetical protein